MNWLKEWDKCVFKRQPLKKRKQEEEGFVVSFSLTDTELTVSMTHSAAQETVCFSSLVRPVTERPRWRTLSLSMPATRLLRSTRRMTAMLPPCRVASRMPLTLGRVSRRTESPHVSSSTRLTERVEAVTLCVLLLC